MPRIELKVTHTHAGVAYTAGHVIDVDEHTARWLIDHKIGELVHRHEPVSAAADAPVKKTKTIKE